MARRTLVAAVLCAAAATLLSAASASGHAGSKDMESIVRGVTPAVPGFSVEVLNGDDRLEVVNVSPKTVTVYGYNDEPYLLMAPGGAVSVNLNSPAYYLNQDRFTGAKVPASANSQAPPRWKVIGRSGRYEFHDHRMHWMARSVPPQVKDESRRTKIFSWSVPLRVGQTPAAIDGELFWRGSDGGAPVGAVVGMGVLLVLSAAAVLVVRRRRRGTGAPGREPREAW